LKRNSMDGLLHGAANGRVAQFATETTVEPSPLETAVSGPSLQAEHKIFAIERHISHQDVVNPLQGSGCGIAEDGNRLQVYPQHPLESASGAIFHSMQRSHVCSDIERYIHEKEPMKKSRKSPTREHHTGQFSDLCSKRYLLPRIQVPATDDEYLYELNVRLQYADNGHALVSVLDEMAVCAVSDFPVQCLLQRGDLLDSVLEIMGSSRAPSVARHRAVQFIHRLTVAMKKALVESADPELVPIYSGTHVLVDDFAQSGC
jgi:hypothetical protein